MKKIYLIDGNAFIYRAFFALWDFSTKDGIPVSALFGMAKFFVWPMVREKPDSMIFIKDAKGKNFRHDLYTDYKATRERMPDSLRSQIPLIEKMLKVMKIPIIEIAGYEADDVIWTLATQLEKDEQNEIFILTWDKDLYSLATDRIKIYDPLKQKISDATEARHKFEVDAPRIIDYLAIVGDSSDNIPWVAGFWPKKAVELINRYGTVESIFEHIEDADFPFTSKMLDKLKEGREIAFLSKKLATIALDVDVPNFRIEDYRFVPANFQTPQVMEFFQLYEFYSLITGKLPEKKLKKWEELGRKVTLITQDSQLESLLPLFTTFKTVYFDTETTGLVVQQAELVGISLLFDESHLYYLNLKHAWEKLSSIAVQSFLQSLLSSPLEIVGHNLKYDLEIVQNFLAKPNKEATSQVKWAKESWQISMF